MSSATANATDDVRGVVALFRAIVFAMANATTVLADLVFIVTECAVEGGKFTQLVPLVVVLSLGG